MVAGVVKMHFGGPYSTQACLQNRVGYRHGDLHEVVSEKSSGLGC